MPCRPINNFEFFRPILEGLGYHHPTLRLPLPLVYYAAWALEGIWAVAAPLGLEFEPLLCRAEVRATGNTARTCLPGPEGPLHDHVPFRDRIWTGSLSGLLCTCRQQPFHQGTPHAVTLMASGPVEMVVTVLCCLRIILTITVAMRRSSSRG